MKIAVHGASGFTGSLIVAELVRRALTPVLVGRDGARLRAVAASAGIPDAAMRVASLEDADALSAAFVDVDAVINAAGPFTTLGEPVVRAALAAGRHYLDTTGEPAYLRHILDTYDAPARAAGVTILPALTDDGGPGDLIAALTAARLDTAVAQIITADLRLPGAASRGTARSMVSIMSQTQLEYRGGTWQPTDIDARTTITAPEGLEVVRVAPIGLPGVFTIPRHVRTDQVLGVIREEVGELFASLSSTVAESIPEAPDAAARTASRWCMLAEATGVDGSRARGWVAGVDAYAATAAIVVEAARRVVSDGAPAGALAPAQAFDAADFLKYLETTGITWQVEQFAAA